MFVGGGGARAGGFEKLLLFFFSPPEIEKLVSLDILVNIGFKTVYATEI